MESQRARSDQPPVVVIVGETGSGKSALAIELAKRFDGEIIAADSRTVYRGMDIGTAKPSVAERQGILHYGIDVVEPDEQFTAHDFQRLANEMVADIARRGSLPIIVGGTGLYIDAFLYDFSFRPPADAVVRQKLQSLSVLELQRRIRAADLPLPENAQNPRHLVRLLEAGIAPQQDKKLRNNTLVLGLRLPQNELTSRISARVESMFDSGLVDEAKALLAQYPDAEALRAPGYRAVSAYLRGEVDLEEAKQQFMRSDLQLAKRQRTWFRRNKSIHWLTGDNIVEQANSLVLAFYRR